MSTAWRPNRYTAGGFSLALDDLLRHEMGQLPHKASQVMDKPSLGSMQRENTSRPC
jgi:hypothetical protein